MKKNWTMNSANIIHAILISNYMKCIQINLCDITYVSKKGKDPPLKLT